MEILGSLIFRFSIGLFQAAPVLTLFFIFRPLFVCLNWIFLSENQTPGVPELRYRVHHRPDTSEWKVFLSLYGGSKDHYRTAGVALLRPAGIKGMALRRRTDADGNLDYVAFEPLRRRLRFAAEAPTAFAFTAKTAPKCLEFTATLRYQPGSWLLTRWVPVNITFPERERHAALPQPDLRESRLLAPDTAEGRRRW